MAAEPPFWSLLLWKRSLLLKILTKTLLPSFHCLFSVMGACLLSYVSHGRSSWVSQAPNLHLAMHLLTRIVRHCATPLNIENPCVTMKGFSHNNIMTLSSRQVIRTKKMSIRGLLVNPISNSPN